MPEFVENDAELMLSLEEQAVGSIANNLTTTVEGYALDARQGKALDDKKLDKSKVANNLTTIEAGLALDARQGKWLYENTIGYDNIANDLTTDNPNKVLSAAQGKVLVAMIEAAKTKLPLAVSGGGTEATDAAKARENLGITPANIGAVSMKTATASLPASGWSNNQQTVSVSGVTSTNTVIVTAAPASYARYNECAVRCSAQGNGTLTFACTDKPTSNLTANVLILQ